jgi:isoquinoline 1-oxidoreductase subunit beta
MKGQSSETASGFLPSIDRRTLLVGGGIGVGLVVAWGTWHWGSRPEQALEQSFGAYLKIGRDGRVIVAVPQTETGQGIWTALPQILADELGASWEMVGVEPAPLSAAYPNPFAEEGGWFEGLGLLRRFRLDDGATRITARSTSVRAFGQPMREAGAAARHMLIAAAADRWNVDPAECDTREGRVVHGGRNLSFGALAEAAASYSPPSNPVLRTSDGPLSGKPLPRLDLPAKTSGTFRFAGDVRLPDMLFASARLAPWQGEIAGFKQGKSVASGENWVAAFGQTWWAAEQALRTADARFEAPRSRLSVEALMDDALAAGEADTLFSRGDYQAAVEGSRALTALYRVAPALHLELEPVTATARFINNHLEVWASAQAPELAKKAAERAAGGASVSFYPMPVGGQSGRAIECDAIPIAVELARRLRRPVHLTLSPAATQHHDHPSPGALARMYALPGAGGITAGWKMRVVTESGLASSLARLAGASPETGPLPELEGIPYNIPNVRIDAVAARLPFAPGYMRGSPERELTFFTESFADELARAAGIDPLSFRMLLLGRNPRLANCLQRATAAAGWDGGGGGSSMGLAAASAFGSHIALVAEASIGSDQRIQVHRLTASVDCGRIANPGIVQQQIEGGLIWALSQAEAPAPEFKGGLALSRAIGSLGLPRIGRTPEIELDLVRNNAEPGGVNGLGVAVLAPAVANAIFAGTGRRLRSLPFDVMGVA